MASGKQSTTVKSYDIYSKLKSWETIHKEQKRYESTHSNELMKKYMSNGYKIEYQPKRDPYAMQKHTNYVFTDRSHHQQKRKGYNEDTKKNITKKQKTDSSKCDTTVKSETREANSAIHQKNKYKEDVRSEKLYVTNQSIAHNQPKPIKQINDDKLVERERKKVDATTHQTSYSYLQHSEKRDNNLSDKTNKEKDDKLKSTPIIVCGKQEAEDKQTVREETKTTKNSKHREEVLQHKDDHFHNIPISVNQYDEIVKKNKGTAVAKTQEKLEEVDREVERKKKDIHRDQSDTTKDFSVVGKDLAAKETNNLQREIAKDEVIREEVKNQFSDKKESIEGHIDEIEDESVTEMENKKKAVKERDYFQPIPAPVIPPVRQAKKTTQKPKQGIKTDEKQDTKSNKPEQTVKPSKNTGRDFKQYGRNKPVEKEPPRTIKYPSREEIALKKANVSPSPENSTPPSSPTQPFPPTTPPASQKADITEDKPEQITPEEEKIMKTLLGISDKCFVKSSRPNVTSA